MQLIVGYDWREILSGLEPSIDIVSVQKTHGTDKDCCSNINTTKQEQTFTLKIEVEKTFGLYLSSKKAIMIMNICVISLLCCFLLLVVAMFKCMINGNVHDLLF